MTEKNDVGRPKKSLKDLPNKWEAKALQLYESGASDVEVRAYALGGICHETWTRLIKEESKFSETISYGKMMSNAWWETQGRVNLENNKFITQLWYCNMKNRFGWADKQEVKQDNSGEINIKWSEEE